MKLKWKDKKALEKKKKVYTVSSEQLDILIKNGISAEVEKIKEEATNKAIETAMVLTLALPTIVLAEKYWSKSVDKKVPKFVNEVLELFYKWENGEITEQDLRDVLWDKAGVKFEYR